MADCAGRVGYLALKNTARDPWEAAIELDRAFCHRGYGSRAVMLFLRRVQELTGRKEFQFLVEVDNLPCQGCMEMLKARLVGINQCAFTTEEETEAFEEKHLDLITEHMRHLAKELRIAPKKLLSHVLDYRLELSL